MFNKFQWQDKNFVAKSKIKNKIKNKIYAIKIYD